MTATATERQKRRRNRLASEIAASTALSEVPQDWLERDAIGSCYDAIAAIGERVRAGEPVPEFLLPRRSEAPR